MTLWFLARSAGFVALLAASLTVALGAVGASSLPAGIRGRSSHLDGRLLAQLVHRSAAVVTLAMLGLHAVLLITDHFVSVSLAGALVPFTAGYRGFALGLGTLAFYGFGTVALSGALRGRLAASTPATRVWRGVHLSAYAAWALAMGHGFLAGTDSGHSWAVLLYAGCAVLVGGAVALRIVSAARHHASPLPATRRWIAAAGGPR